MCINYKTRMMNNECDVCYEEVICVKCSEGSHKVCWICMRKLISNTSFCVNGDLSCSMCVATGSDSNFEMKNLMKQSKGEIPDDVFDSLLNLKVNDGIIKGMKSEKLVLDKMNRTKTRSDVVRNDIVNNVLPNKCPKKNCNNVFYDFEGCYSINCSECKTYFCAWCFKNFPSAKESHAHVIECDMSLAKGELFSDIKLFHKVRNQQKGKLISKILSKEPPDVINKVYRDLKFDLKTPYGMININNTLQSDKKTTEEISTKANKNVSEIDEKLDMISILLSTLRNHMDTPCLVELTCDTLYNIMDAENLKIFKKSKGSYIINELYAKYKNTIPSVENMKKYT